LEVLCKVADFIFRYYPGLYSEQVSQTCLLPHNQKIWVLIYLFVIYFIVVKGKNSLVGIFKLPVKLMLLQPSKYSRSVCSRIMYYIFIKDKKNTFLSSILPDAAAFSCSMHRKISSLL